MRKFLIFFSTAIFLNANSLTIYNNNLGYIKEDKNISIKKGLQTLKYTNLPKTIIIDSIAPEINSKSVKLYSLQFNESMGFRRAILEQNLNKEVSFFTKDKKLLSGILKRSDPIVVEANSKYYIVDSISQMIFNNYPNKDNINSYLELKLSSKENIDSKIRLNYLIKGISWSTNYILTLKKDKLNLKAWATIINNSDKEFKEYNLNLISGNLNKVSNYSRRIYRKSRSMALEAVEPAVAKIPEVGEAKAIEGYYLYNVPFKVTISKNQTKQISLIEANNIKYKIYGVAKNSAFYYYDLRKFKFSQIVEFKNSKENSLGKPLPAGVVRAYKDGYYLGENIISNIPKDEKVKIAIGELFDIVGKSKVIKFVNKSKYKYIKKEYIVKNRGKRAYEVRIKEEVPRYGDSIKFNTTCKDECKVKEKSAFYKEYTINLKPDSEYKFYTEYEIVK